MNITFLVSRFLNGGIETVLLRYLDALSADNNLTLIIGNGYGEQQTIDLTNLANVKVEYLVNDGILTSVLKKKYTHQASPLHKIADAVCLCPIRRSLQRLRLRKSIRNQDLVVDFDSTFHSLLPKRSDAFRAPAVSFFHFSLRNYHRGNQAKQRKLCDKLLRYDHIVVICEQMKKEFLEFDNRFGNNISTIYNPVDESKILEMAAEYPAPQEEYILSVSRLIESQKDNTTLLKAYAKAKSVYPTIPKLIIIGNGPDKPYLMNLAKDLGIEKHTDFKGFVGNPMPYISNTKLLVLSSKFEGLPTVLIEGLTLNRAIVSTNCPTGPSEILDNENCGKLVPIGDADRMAEAMVEVLTDSALRNKYMQNIIRQKQIFSIANSIKCFYNVCASLKPKGNC